MTTLLSSIIITLAILIYCCIKNIIHEASVPTLDKIMLIIFLSSSHSPKLCDKRLRELRHSDHTFSSCYYSTAHIQQSTTRRMLKGDIHKTMLYMNAPNISFCLMIVRYCYYVYHTCGTSRSATDS